MKNLLCILLLFCSTQIFAQNYSEVVQVEGKTTSELYTAAREWFAVTFNSANDVLQMEDPEGGKLIGKGSTSVSEIITVGKGLYATSSTLTMSPNFTIKIEMREGRYKCDIYSITLKSYSQYTGATEISLADYKKDLEYYDNATDPEWLQNNPPEGLKINKSLAKSMAKTMEQSKHAAVSIIKQTESQMEGLMESLETAMKKETTTDDW